MKRVYLLLPLGALLACPIFAQSTGSTNTSPNPPPPGEGPPHGDHQGMLTKEERDEVHKAHDDALQANPDLADEGKDLMEKMQAYQKKVDAAMIKADPKVAPLLAKMEAGRQHHDGFGGPPPPPPGN